MRMLVPMAKIMEAEQVSMKVEGQKIQKATLALQRVQEECHHALVDLTKEYENFARNLEEPGNALEDNRLAAEEAGRKLAEKIINSAEATRPCRPPCLWRTFGILAVDNRAYSISRLSSA